MIKNIWKDPLFIVGFLFVFGLLVASFYHLIVLDNEIYEEQYINNEEGMPIEKAPFEPSSHYWFGSDRMGADLFSQIISGAKYTLGIALVVSLLRVGLSFLGSFLLWRAGRVMPFIKGLSQSFYYIPSALLIFFVVGPIIQLENYTFWEKAFFEMLLIIAIAVPNTSILIKEEINLIEKEEFITSAKLMGGSRLRILSKHILPHLWPKLLLIYVQQVIAVLLLLAHLGILGVFFGGTTMREFTNEYEIPASDSNEWSGLIGGYYYQLRLAPWLVFFPVFSFAAVILAFNFIAEGIKRSANKLPIPKTVKSKDERKPNISLVENKSFVFLSQKKTG